MNEHFLCTKIKNNEKNFFNEKSLAISQFLVEKYEYTKTRQKLFVSKKIWKNSNDMIHDKRN